MKIVAVRSRAIAPGPSIPRSSAVSAGSPRCGLGSEGDLLPQPSDPLSLNVAQVDRRLSQTKPARVIC